KVQGENTIHHDPYVYYGFASMFADGLAHRVKIEDKKLTVWPNLGHGKFDQAMTIENIEGLTIAADALDTRTRMVLADVNGSGYTDIVLCYTDHVKILLNQSGHSFAAPLILTLPKDVPFSTFDHIQFTDVTGNGTNCLVFSKTSPGITHYYTELGDKDQTTQLGKPFLLHKSVNNMGIEHRIHYKSSTKDYLKAQAEGQPWSCKLNFVTQVIDKTTTIDHISQTQLTNEYTYRNGYYDPNEHSFIGFGCVEHRDLPANLHQEPNEPKVYPVISKQWFHLGAGTDEAAIKQEFFKGDAKAPDLPFHILKLKNPNDQRSQNEALFALAGSPIHTEVYDGTESNACPYSVNSACFTVVEDVAPTEQQKGIYRIYGNESFSLNYEKIADDPHVSHQLAIKVDEYNHVLQSAAIAYPRRNPLIPEQGELHCSATSGYLRIQTEKGKARWIGVGTETQSFDISGLTLPAGQLYFDYESVRQFISKALQHPIAYSETPKTDQVVARMLSWSKPFYWKNQKQKAILDLANDDIPALLLAHHSEAVVFDQTDVQKILGNRLSKNEIKAAGYFFCEGYWWSRSSVIHYDTDPTSFYPPIKVSNDWMTDQQHYLYTESTVEYDSYAMFAIKSSQRLNAEQQISSSVKIDYHYLTAWQMIDANHNISEAVFDELGAVIATSIRGKDQGLMKGDAPITEYRKVAAPSVEAILNQPLKYIQKAGSYFYYEFPSFDGTHWQPARTVALGRMHYQSRNPDDISKGVTYSDGLGRVIESKAWAGKGKLSFSGAECEHRWLASGRVIYDAKERPWKNYQAYFTDTFEHEKDWDSKIKPKLPKPTVHTYDAIGRTIRVDTPKGYFSKVEMPTAWRSHHFDANDTVKDSAYYQNFMANYQAGQSEAKDDEYDALTKAAIFYNTPSTSIIDNLGRAVLAIADNRVGAADYTQIPLDGSDPNVLISKVEFDREGRVIHQIDPRFYVHNLQTTKPSQKQYNFVHVHPLAGGLSYTSSADAGESRGFIDSAGNAFLGWDALGNTHRTTYDQLHRPLTKSVKTSEGASRVHAVMIYGENYPDATAHNMIGKAWKVFNNAGMIETKGYSFDGKPELTQMRFRKNYKNDADWNPDNLRQHEDLLEASSKAYATSHTIDAMGRPLSQTLPDQSVINWTYSTAGHCIGTNIKIEGTGRAHPIVTNAVMDEFERLAAVHYANGVVSAYDYDDETHELIGLKHQKGSNAPFQHLVYTHDPTSLITTMRNQAQTTVFHSGQKVEPLSRYTFNALYQLKKVEGRLLKGIGHKSSGGPQRAVHQQAPFQVANLKAVENYREQFEYDLGGNMIKLQRTATNSYTRNYEIDSKSNRVVQFNEQSIAYDAAGQMQQLTEGAIPLVWNDHGNIAKATLVKRQGKADDAEYYVYLNGIRVRKVTETLSYEDQITIVDKRDLGGYRHTIKTQGQKVLTNKTNITISGVHKQDCIVEYYQTRKGQANTDLPLFRYQHADHLNSVGQETNQEGKIISYEEYSIFGETTFRWTDTALDISPKEYRYSSQEKDMNTGLYYYGYRYYAPWLCRWTRPDPAGTVDGLNLYAMVGNEPVGRVDVMGAILE
ncbi:MAG: toxin TcdB middle/N-terminal domain-containing protein, partial [Bacteroidota bacterium]